MDPNLPTPPRSEDEALIWLQLIRSRRVGPSTFYRLLAEYGSADAALSALPDIAAKAGVKDYTPHSEIDTRREYLRGCEAGARLLAIGTPDYPRALARIDGAPPLLWCLGNPRLAARPTLAVVGARNASSLGLRMTRALAGDLAKAGYVIASGAARGIDRAAHEAALQTGTIAVLAGGVDVPYPREHAGLLRDIARQGAVLSEQPPGLVPQARNFPQRNRLISGLSRALIVIEAAAKSGSLITARDALDQGRDVLAVPGHPFDPRAGGTNQLLRDGATLIRGADDVIDALGTAPIPEHHPGVPPDEPTPPAPSPERPRPTASRPAPSDNAAAEARILALLSTSPIEENQLIRDLDLPAAAVGPMLTELEMLGRITRSPGGLLSASAPTGLPQKRH